MIKTLSWGLSILAAIQLRPASAQECVLNGDISFVRTIPNLDSFFDNKITTPLIGDVDGTGEQKIYFLRDQFIYGLSADGSDLPNFPVDLAGLAGTPFGTL